MVIFCWNNSYTKRKSNRFSFVAILCILSIHVLLCLARPTADESSTGYESTTDSEAEAIKEVKELSFETRKTIEDFHQDQENITEKKVGDLESHSVGYIPKRNDHDDENTSINPKSSEFGIGSTNTRTLVLNKGVTLKNYNLVLFVSVLLCIYASIS